MKSIGELLYILGIFWLIRIQKMKALISGKNPQLTDSRSSSVHSSNTLSWWTSLRVVIGVSGSVHEISVVFPPTLTRSQPFRWTHLVLCGVDVVLSLSACWTATTHLKQRHIQTPLPESSAGALQSRSQPCWIHLAPGKKDPHANCVNAIGTIVRALGGHSKPSRHGWCLTSWSRPPCTELEFV